MAGETAVENVLHGKIRNKAPASLQVPCFFDSQRAFAVDGVKGAGQARR